MKSGSEQIDDFLRIQLRLAWQQVLDETSKIGMEYQNQKDLLKGFNI